MSKKRKRPTRAEQLIPCQACGYPMSQRHHMLNFAEYGDNDVVIELCPNCHALYHIIERADRAAANGNEHSEAMKLRAAVEGALIKGGRADVVNFLLDLTTEAWHYRQAANNNLELMRSNQRRQS